MKFGVIEKPKIFLDNGKLVEDIFPDNSIPDYTSYRLYIADCMEKGIEPLLLSEWQDQKHLGKIQDEAL